FLLLPVAAFAALKPLLRLSARLLPNKAQKFVAEIENGLPLDAIAFARAWAMTIVNWLVKVMVLAWALGLMGAPPKLATIGSTP
ncbi:UPF0104 family protein, partial [Rhizobium ruizarguesonis]